MFRFLRPRPLPPLTPVERHEQPLSFPRDCQTRLKGTRVAVVGGGLAGLMAARQLVQQGIKVTVFEARSQVGGRVQSNRTFSPGRITEEGAELIGSFHTRWLALAQHYGLAMISRMDENLYQRACLDVRLILEDKPWSMNDIKTHGEKMKDVLLKMAINASQIKDPSEPWWEESLRQYDDMSVATALDQLYGVKPTGPTERLWKALEFKLVNDEVAPLDKMNYLGLLCKVKAGQGEQCGGEEDDYETRMMGYWDRLEIFRCADGCQKLATMMADEISTKNIHMETAVTHIDIYSKNIDINSKKCKLLGVPNEQRHVLAQKNKPCVVLGHKKVKNQKTGELADGPPVFTVCDYVILAIPPSVWVRSKSESVEGVTITVDCVEVDLKLDPGVIDMYPAAKFFSDVKKRFWIAEKAAPLGGTSKLGQVWEGTDNQTQVGKQGIVLSVFAGPILDMKTKPRVPRVKEFRDELKKLYRDYPTKSPFHFSDWPTTPFIKTGYASPGLKQIFEIGPKLIRPFHDRLFFAGEHTRMDFFGYMEGALRSGEYAAKILMQQLCGLLPAPASPKPAPAPPKPAPAPPKPAPPVLTASAAPIRAKTAFEHDIQIPLAERSSADYPGEAESPFLHQEFFVKRSEEEWEPRTAALEAESPFVNALEERRSRFDEDQLKEEEAPDELEDEEELEAEEVREELEEDQLTPQTDQVEDESLDDEGAPLREDETELESPENLEELYSHVHEHELDQGEERAELNSTVSATSSADSSTAARPYGNDGEKTESTRCVPTSACCGGSAPTDG